MAKQILILLTLLLSFQGFAQITNLGELYISENTQMSAISLLDNTVTGDLLNDGELLIYNDFNNDGLVSFTPDTDTGLTKFVGDSENQSITGSEPVDFNNVKFNNTADNPEFIVSTRINIFANADFVNGIIKNDSNAAIVFDTDATFSNVSDDSYIEGEVTKKGSNPFAFPIGANGKFVYSYIADNGSEDDAYRANYFMENSNSIAPHSGRGSNIEFIDNKQYWQKKIKTGSSSEDVRITLSLREDVADSRIITAPTEDITILGWNASLKTWIDLGGEYSEEHSVVTSVAKALEYCSVFTFAKIKSGLKNAIRPLQLLSPNGDGKNDFFYIENIDKAPENSLQIFNRWGISVYNKEGYTNDPDESFKGIATTKGTLGNGDLPEGTYFFILTYKDTDGKQKNIRSYLYLRR